LRNGYRRAHKYDDEPSEDAMLDYMHDYIWFEIDRIFDFERNLCSEVVEGLDHLPKHLRPKLLYPLDQQKEYTSDEPRDGEIRAVNYTTGATEDGQPITNHRLEQYYSGEWREISVYDEDKDGNLSPREIDRLRAKKKEIYEDLKDAVDREWVGLTPEDVPNDPDPRFDTDEFLLGMKLAETILKEKNT